MLCLKTGRYTNEAHSPLTDTFVTLNGKRLTERTKLKNKYK